MVYFTEDEGGVMDELIKLLDENLEYVDHRIDGEAVVIRVRSVREDMACPFCGRISSRVHSTYSRSFQDLPIQGKKTYINIANRKMFCDNPKCRHTTFAESFDCLAPKSKKSNRLLGEILKVSLEVSSVTASRILREGVVDVGKSTICNILKKNHRNIGQGKRRENMH
jgi:transposase